MIREFLEINRDLNKQLKWELLKYEVKKFIISYTRKIAKEKRASKENLEKQIASFNAANVDQENEAFKRRAKIWTKFMKTLLLALESI